MLEKEMSTDFIHGGGGGGTVDVPSGQAAAGQRFEMIPNGGPQGGMIETSINQNSQGALDNLGNPDDMTQTVNSDPYREPIDVEIPGATGQFSFDTGTTPEVALDPTISESSEESVGQPDSFSSQEQYPQEAEGTQTEIESLKSLRADALQNAEKTFSDGGDPSPFNAEVTNLSNQISQLESKQVTLGSDGAQFQVISPEAPIVAGMENKEDVASPVRPQEFIPTAEDKQSAYEVGEEQISPQGTEITPENQPVQDVEASPEAQVTQNEEVGISPEERRAARIKEMESHVEYPQVNAAESFEDLYAAIDRIPSNDLFGGYSANEIKSLIRGVEHDVYLIDVITRQAGLRDKVFELYLAKVERENKEFKALKERNKEYLSLIADQMRLIENRLNMVPPTHKNPESPDEKLYAQLQAEKEMLMNMQEDLGRLMILRDTSRKRLYPDTASVREPLYEGELFEDDIITPEEEVRYLETLRMFDKDFKTHYDALDTYLIEDKRGGQQEVASQTPQGNQQPLGQQDGNQQVTPNLTGNQESLAA